MCSDYFRQQMLCHPSNLRGMSKGYSSQYPTNTEKYIKKSKGILITSASNINDNKRIKKGEGKQLYVYIERQTGKTAHVGMTEKGNSQERNIFSQ